MTIDFSLLFYPRAGGEESSAHDTWTSNNAKENTSVIFNPVTLNRTDWFYSSTDGILEVGLYVLGVDDVGGGMV